ncbi:MAG TPA: rhomboid family intramembrane serine protease [Candidatus Glassbacteria bacterium]|nr:rhomboid family intramembrane serine protease [Candidatus Glassbacteria bacterium]
MIPFKDNVPTRRPPVMTVLLIAVNCLVFIYQQTLPHDLQVDLVYLLGAVPARLADFQSWFFPGVHNPAVSLVSSMFMHGGWLHLGGNMLYLWIFGNNVEDSMGRLRFLVFYLFCGCVAAAAQVASAPESTVPMVGASGAVSGVLGAYLILHPFARVHTLIFIFFFIRVVELPAILVLGVWFMLQIFNSLAAPQGASGVAWLAHVGGFVSGLLLIRFFQNRRLSRSYSWH